MNFMLFPKNEEKIWIMKFVNEKIKIGVEMQAVANGEGTV